MKFYLPIVLTLPWVAVLSAEPTAPAPAAVPAAAKPAPVMRDAATHDQLVQEHRKSLQADPMKQMKPSNVEDPAKNLPQGLISQSDFISFNGLTTLVPKRAILQFPKDYADRLKFVQGNRIVNWPEFYQANRGWISTLEISRAQAEGNAPLPDETKEQLTKCTQMVVCTFKGGPISILPLKVTEAKPVEAAVKP